MKTPLAIKFALWLCILASVMLSNGLLAQDTQQGHKAESPTLTVASKSFTESVILAELLRQLAVDSGSASEHISQLGGTRIVWNALLAGEVDAYVDYSGTLQQEILQLSGSTSWDTLAEGLAEYGVRISRPLGFNNTYALGIPQELAKSLGLERISQLREHPDVVMGFSNEFMDRPDGWPGVRMHYQLPQQSVTGLDHDLAYRALQSGDIQLTDLYSTDAEVDYYQLQVLDDDEHFFPPYQALIVYRADVENRFPQVLAAWKQLTGHIDATQMSQMNAQVKIHGKGEAQVASTFLQTQLGITSKAQGIAKPSALSEVARYTWDHLQLVLVSLFMAIVVAIPLGIFAAKNASVGRGILALSSVLQTIPSLALFVVLIPLLGIGAAPAIAALFLYSLLPIVRNTHSGLTQIPQHLQDSSRALGLSPGYRLRRIELPLALPTIIAGIQTAAVINVGTATLAALVGAGGYGQPILTGIRLDDFGLILQGAAPAALMAVAVQGGFQWLGGRLTTKH